MSNLELLRERHSVRSYKKITLDESVRNKLRSIASFVNSHEAGLRFVPIFNDDAPFRGFGRSYGMFRNVENYLAVIIDPTFENTLERAGYYAEEFVIEAVKLGLGTCFVGGTFSKNHIDTIVEVYERIPFVIAFGISDIKNTSTLAKLTSCFVHRKALKPREFFLGTDDDYNSAVEKFPWLNNALQAIASAPSALNLMPVRLSMINSDINEDNEMGGVTQIAASTIDPEKYPIELGIAKYNIAYAVGGMWDWGNNATFYPDEV